MDETTGSSLVSGYNVIWPMVPIIGLIAYGIYDWSATQEIRQQISNIEKGQDAEALSKAGRLIAIETKISEAKQNSELAKATADDTLKRLNSGLEGVQKVVKLEPIITNNKSRINDIDEKIKQIDDLSKILSQHGKEIQQTEKKISQALELKDKTETAVSNLNKAEARFDEVNTLFSQLNQTSHDLKGQAARLEKVQGVIDALNPTELVYKDQLATDLQDQKKAINDTIDSLFTVQMRSYALLSPDIIKLRNTPLQKPIDEVLSGAIDYSIALQNGQSTVSQLEKLKSAIQTYSTAAQLELQKIAHPTTRSQKEKELKAPLSAIMNRVDWMIGPEKGQIASENYQKLLAEQWGSVAVKQAAASSYNDWVVPLIIVGFTVAIIGAWTYSEPIMKFFR